MAQKNPDRYRLDPSKFTQDFFCNLKTTTFYNCSKSQKAKSQKLLAFGFWFFFCYALTTGFML
jgi:hypothetical protein